jgi:hypothetical protein
MGELERLRLGIGQLAERRKAEALRGGARQSVLPGNALCNAAGLQTGRRTIRVDDSEARRAITGEVFWQSQNNWIKWWQRLPGSHSRCECFHSDGIAKDEILSIRFWMDGCIPRSNSQLTEIQTSQREKTLMKTKARILSRMGGLLTLAVILMAAKPAFAQEDNHVPTALLGGFLFIFCIILLVAYVYHALALQTIAQKTNTDNPWLAWIPIANLILMLNIAKKPIWWIILFLIPLVNIVFIILVWMGIAEARNKPNWWGILMIVPPVNIIVPGYLAWSD